MLHTSQLCYTTCCLANLQQIESSGVKALSHDPALSATEEKGGRGFVDSEPEILCRKNSLFDSRHPGIDGCCR